mgnify:CR=1 FL=1
MRRAFLPLCDRSGFHLSLFAERHLGSDLGAWMLAGAGIAGAAGADAAVSLLGVDSPLIDGARNSRFSSSDPKRASAGVAMSVCTPIAMGMAPQATWPKVCAMTTEKE